MAPVSMLTAVIYLSIFRCQMERGPKVVVSSIRICPFLQQHRHHLSVTAGTRYVELQHSRDNGVVMGWLRQSKKLQKQIRSWFYQSDSILIGQTEAFPRRQKLCDIRHHCAASLHLHCVNG